VELHWEEHGETLKEDGSGLQLQGMAVGSEGETCSDVRKGKKNAYGLGKVAINDPSSAGRFGAPTQ
jgi:hypothetical protein